MPRKAPPKPYSYAPRDGDPARGKWKPWEGKKRNGGRKDRRPRTA